MGTFEDKARDLLGDGEFEGVLELLAKKPKSGGIIKGSGGLRKVRIARKGAGKSGGTRVIYYYHNETKPILLLQIYAKADQEDLTGKQRIRLKKLVDELLDNFK
jgi:hypothetical protein